MLAYVVTGIVFLTIDAVWLFFSFDRLYRPQLGNLLAKEVRFGVASMFYLLFVAGIVIFAVAPALQSGSARDALLFGSLFGLFTYATYDMTNLATIRGWPLLVSIVDIAWGTTLTGIAALTGFYGSLAFG